MWNVVVGLTLGYLARILYSLAMIIETVEDGFLASGQLRCGRRLSDKSNTISLLCWHSGKIPLLEARGMIVDIEL